MKPSTPLPVLESASSSLSALEEDLRQSIRGQVRFGLHDRALYSTDASPYQVMPLGVVVPADVDEVARVVQICAQHRMPMLPRGGGTSLAGQCTNRAVVIDLSPLCRGVLRIDPEAKVCQVEPGIGVDELNRQLLKTGFGLFYAPDPATVAQASIGGCIGNNAAGARSIVYGRTSESVEAVEVVLANGERVELSANSGSRDPIARDLSLKVAEVVQRYAPLIRERFPKTIRRNAGYGLDLILQQLDAGVSPGNLDLSKLICGSEGTLAIVVGARLKIHPIRKSTALAIASFATLEEAMDALNPILKTKPSAVELLDDVVIRAAMGNDVCRPYVDLLPRAKNGAAPMAVLYVEYQADDSAGIDEGFKQLSETLAGTSVQYFRETLAMAKAWTLRKSGEALLHGLPGNRKPQTFVEDNAVPPENLPRFVREFKKIVAKHGTEAAYWAHASVGVLHVRPMIDLHADEDRAIMRKIAVEVAELARDCGGVMSGEHGDGRVRGPLLEHFYGPELMKAFAEIKAIFDPHNLLNPGNIVGAGPIQSITQNLRVDSTQTRMRTIETYYDYADQDDFGHAVEMCNGAGFCRKTAGGTMCPSYRGTLDERHSTRGRGNALRQAIRVGLGDGQPAWNDPETFETLDLCLSCKACKTECPTNVDVARLKAEYLAQSWKARGGPTLKARFFGHVRSVNRLGSIFPSLSNFVGNLAPVRAITNALLGIAPQRTLPPFAKSLYRWFESRDVSSNGRPKVVLYADCFATYNEPNVGRAAVKLLEAFGYDVVLPEIACCGRAMISTGLLEDAIASADRALETISFAMKDAVAVVVCEPSCLSAITDDWLQLKLKTPIARRKEIARKSFLVEDFLDLFWDSHPLKPALQSESSPIILHGHCHQKSVGGGEETSARLLRRLTTGTVTILASGCCGMAGSFGYSAEKYDLSMKIGELSVFPPIRAARDAIICAPGTSCRHQIHDGTGREALHPIEVAAGLIQ